MIQKERDNRGAIAAAVFAIFAMSLAAVASAYNIGHYSKTAIYFKSRCSTIGNEPQCVASGCSWWDDSCHPYAQYLYEEGEYCVDLDKDVTYCMTSTQDYLIIGGVMTNV